MKLFTSVEIPALDFERAVRFYKTMLDVQIKNKEHGGHIGGFIQGEDGEQAIILCVPEFTMPSNQGLNVYFNTEKIKTALSAVKENGGQIIVPATDNGYGGLFAWVIDSEGNRVALWQETK